MPRTFAAQRGATVLLGLAGDELIAVTPRPRTHGSSEANRFFHPRQSYRATAYRYVGRGTLQAQHTA